MGRVPVIEKPVVDYDRHFISRARRCLPSPLLFRSFLRLFLPESRSLGTRRRENEQKRGPNDQRSRLWVMERIVFIRGGDYLHCFVQSSEVMNDSWLIKLIMFLLLREGVDKENSNYEECYSDIMFLILDILNLLVDAR